MIKSPLRYPGGKSRSADFIVKYIPDFKEFREPFVGGGSIFLHLKEKYPKRHYWINDINNDLISFYRESRYHVNDLINKIKDLRSKNLTTGKELFNNLKLNIGKLTKIDKASAFFVINRSSFSGTSLSGGFSQTAFNKRFTVSCIDRIVPFSKLLKKNLKITAWDYERVLEREGKGVFVYLDPPYYTPEKSGLYGRNGNFHRGFDHERLAKILKKSKFKWLISYDDCEYIRELYSGYNIVHYDASYGMKNVSKEKHSEQTGKEILIMNY